MRIREMLQAKPSLGIGIAVGALLITMCMLWFTFGKTGPGITMAGQLYYSDDDGKTFFTDDSSKIPPFDHNGKQAVQAVVFRCDGKPDFVGYLLRYASSGHDELMKLPEDARRGSAPNVIELRRESAEVKKPGTGKWQLIESDRSVGVGDILKPHCPDGSSGTPTQVMP